MLGGHARIVGWGKYLPSTVLTNFDLEQRLPTSDEWITTRTGIKERRLAGDTETPATMGVIAAKEALANAGLDSQDVDLIIVATSSPERVLPATAGIIQRELGLRNIGAFDLNAACSGFVYGLSVASQFVAAGVHRNVLVVGSEVYSRLLDWEDRSTCVLFGDGAGAAVVQQSQEPGGILSWALGNESDGVDMIYVHGVGAASAESESYPYLVMQGSPVYKAAVRALVDSTKHVTMEAGLELADIDLLIPHQANLRIIRSASESLGIPDDKVFVNVDRYGNTAAASIPIALCEAVETGRLKKGDQVVLTTVGAGISWAAMAMEWQPQSAATSE